MLNKLKINRLYWLSIPLLIIALDQYSKFLITSSMVLTEEIKVFPFFSLFFVFNSGAAFSFLADAGGWQKWFFGSLSLIVSLGIVWWLFYSTKSKSWDKFSLMLVLGGALGNLIDRLQYSGQVVDFLYFYWKNFHFAAFNIADSAITVGAIMFALNVIFSDRSN